MRWWVVLVAVGIWLCAAPAQAQAPRLAAPSDCLTNTGCGVGLRSVYGLDVRQVFVPLTIADLPVVRRRGSGSTAVPSRPAAPAHDASAAGDIESDGAADES